MVEQKYFTKLTKPAKLKYNHSVGTSVTKVDHYIDKNTGEGTWFVAPKVDGLYFERANQLFQEAIRKKQEIIGSKKFVNPKDPTQGKAFINEKAVFEFFSISSAGIVLLFSAVEAKVNNAIESCKNLNYIDKKAKTIFKIKGLSIKLRRSKKLSKEEILFLDINTKLKKVLPFLYNFESPVKQSFWQDFIGLKKFRDGLVHSLSSKSYGASQNQNSLFAELLDLDFDKLLRSIKNLISFIDK